MADPLYVAYDDCVRIQHNPQSVCLQNWADAKNFVSCGLHVPYTGSYNADTPEIQSQCNAVIPPSPSGCTHCPACFSGTQIIKKEVWDPATNTWVDDQISVAPGTKVKYRTTLTLGLFDTVNTTLTGGEIKFYDFVIPSESGNIWKRNGIIGPSWNWISGGKYYKKTLSSTEINNLNSGGLVTSIEYEMDSEIAINKNESNYLKNVTFAVIEYDYSSIEYDYSNVKPYCSNIESYCSNIKSDCSNVESDCSSSVIITNGSRVLGLKNLQSCHANTLPLSQIYSGSTLGDNAKVRIIRPRLETLGGNIGVEVTGTSEERLFGTGNNFGGQIITNKTDLFESGDPTRDINDFNAQKTFLENSRNDFFNNLKQNAFNDASFFGKTFKATPSDSGIYFGNGDLQISGQFNPTKSATFILESGDLTITNDFEIQGNNFAAFIVRTGDLIIKSNVKELDGIFIIEKGEIKSDIISQNPLTVSGSLMGNGEDLLKKRKFIGTDPEFKIEPAVKVNFDLRLLEQTPPALEMFLGENWREDVE